MEDIEEPKPLAEKVKKPRTEKQIEAFKKAQENRAKNIVFRDVGGGGQGGDVFGWRPYLFINDINKVGDVLYWTSRQYGEPCSINVRKSINSMILIDSQGTNSNQNGLAYILNEEGGTDNISLEDHYPFYLV